MTEVKGIKLVGVSNLLECHELSEIKNCMNFIKIKEIENPAE